MNDNEINIAIAEACPTVFTRKNGCVFYRFDHQRAGKMVSPVDDLNAMHSAEKTLTLDQRRLYWQHLYRITEKGRMAEPSWLTTTATASQRAEAFLRTLGKWKD